MLSDGQKQLSTNEAIKCTMLCFCDIPQDQLEIHMKKYGRFGIAFPKQFLLNHGATPVYYVARNARNHAIGVGGPRNVAERFDQLRSEIQSTRIDLEKYVTRIDGAPAFLSKLPSRGTPEGHRVLGRFAALAGEFEELIFARTKFFTVGLSDDAHENYYMEREWRLPDGLSFRLENIARIILPRDYCQRFHGDVPDYNGEVLPVDLNIHDDRIPSHALVPGYGSQD